jgi:hypothetical protein
LIFNPTLSYMRSNGTSMQNKLGEPYPFQPSGDEDLPKYPHSFFAHFATYSPQYGPAVSINIDASFGAPPLASKSGQRQ